MTALISGTSLISYAGDHGEAPHGSGTISGSEINLFAMDHAFSGMIKNTLVFGNLDEETGMSELSFKKSGKIFHATFGKKNASIQGVIESENPDETMKSTEISFVSMDPKEKSITVKINAEEIKVMINADDFQNNHFINPTYSAVMNGKAIQFKLSNGKACYRFSTHLIMMILGSMSHF